jgi:hypothetical protein
MNFVDRPQTFNRILSPLATLRLEVHLPQGWCVINSLSPDEGPVNKRLLRLEVQKMQWQELEYFGKSPLRITGE